MHELSQVYAMLHLSEYIKLTVALLVIVNPLGTLPVFVLMTQGETDAVRRNTAAVASIAVATVLVVAVLLGESLLAFFGISIASFKVGGAILILLMAISMMDVRAAGPKQTPEEAAEAAADKESIAVVPLAIPLLAGPGAISTTIIYTAKVHGVAHIAAVILVCLVVSAISWVVLRAGIRLAELMGRTGVNVATRVMGLLLAAVAVEIFASGIVELLPGLGPAAASVR